MTTLAPQPLPAAARLAWWGTAWLRGHVVTDLLLDAVIGEDATHVMTGLVALGLGDRPDRIADRDAAAETFVAGLGRLRAAGATGFGAAFPVEGDLVGLGGPRDFNAEALENGEAVVVVGAEIGLVPARVGAAVTWTAYRAQRRQLPDVGDADRQLRAALIEAANTLSRLDVAGWRPEIADRLLNLRHRAPVAAPTGVPVRCLDLAGRGLHAMDIAGLGLDDDGGAVTAHQMNARRGALRPLERAGRRALVAACSPEVWPPD